MESGEELESGYGPTTPGGDNVLNDFARGEARGFRALAAARGDRIDDDDALALTLTDSGSPSPFGNTAFVERPLQPQEWDAAVARMHGFYAQRAGGPFMLFSGWPTPDLRGRGFGLIGHPPMMWRPSGSVSAPADGLDIRAVTSEDDAGVFERVLVRAYPVPELEPFRAGCLIPSPAHRAPGWRFAVGYLDGVPVATSAAFATDAAVHVEFISSLPECRGRGIGAAMTAVATAHDSLPAMLIASDSGRSVYERLGYASLLRYTLWAGHRRSA